MMKSLRESLRAGRGWLAGMGSRVACFVRSAIVTVGLGPSAVPAGGYDIGERQDEGDYPVDDAQRRAIVGAIGYLDRYLKT